jgi:hypothetical protein
MKTITFQSASNHLNFSARSGKCICIKIEVKIILDLIVRLDNEMSIGIQKYKNVSKHTVTKDLDLHICSNLCESVDPNDNTLQIISLSIFKQIETLFLYLKIIVQSDTILF